MRIPIKALCEEKRLRADGTSVIYFQFFCESERRIFLNTGLAVPPGFWDKRKEAIKETLPAEFGDLEKLNEDIDRQLKLAVGLIQLAKRQCIAEIGPYVKEKYHPFLDLEKLALEDFNLNTPYVPQTKKRKEPFFDQWDKYVLSKTGKVADSTITAFGFCTNEFLAGTPVKLIMLISGHKSEKGFYRYIRIDAREAAERIKELWMERDAMEVFKNPLKKALNLQTI